MTSTLVVPATLFSVAGCSCNSKTSPSEEFDVQLYCDTEITLSNTKFSLKKEYETTITNEDSSRSIQTIEIKVGNRHLKTNEYTFNDNTLTIGGKYVIDKNLSITITTMLNDPISDETPEDYIYNRTFSLKAYGHVLGSGGASYAYFGTGWIIDDATPNIENDYIYYVATNWHVTHGFEYLLDRKKYADTYYEFADQSLQSGTHQFIDYMNYLDIKSFEVLNYPSSLYTKDDNETPTQHLHQCIDMVVCKIDFGSSDLDKSEASQIKNKLNNLNELRRTKGCINRFANSLNNDILTKKKFSAGYPCERMGSSFEGGIWAIQELPSNSLKTYQRNEFGFKWEEEGQFQKGHSICDYPYADQQGNKISYVDIGGEPFDGEEFYNYDVSPQYESKEWIQLDQWAMEGGASGSMLITEDCEVCGIFWGGSVGFDDKLIEYFKPTFSLFKTNDKDFMNVWNKK